MNQFLTGSTPVKHTKDLELSMKKPNSVERIVNRYGWKTTNGRVEYKGFEHLLNPDMPDWRFTDEDFEDTPILVREIEQVVLSPAAQAALKVRQENHNKLLEAQKRVDKLKTKLKK